MGTIKKNVDFKKINLASGGSYTRRERGFAAQAPLSGPPPACRSVPAHTPGERTPRLIKSSTHFRARFLQKLFKLRKLTVHKISLF